MFSVVPDQNIGIHAFIPMCDASNAHIRGGLHVPETHVYKENKLKIAKHSGSFPRCQQFNAADLSKKLSSGFENNGSLSNSYGTNVNKKRKADEANLHPHDEMPAAQAYCRYVPASPIMVHRDAIHRVIPVGCLPMHRHLPQLAVCSSNILNATSSNVASSSYVNSQAVVTTVSKANPKPSTTQGDYAIVVGEVLRSSNESYEVMAFLGRGTFGQVVKCRCQSSRRCVAIKILKNLPSYLRQGNVEIQILQTLSQQDTESHNIVRAIECFQHRNHMCFVFELLEQNLYEYLKSNKFRPLSLPEIRPIAQQVLTALSKLKSLGLIHADLKPENIMLVSSNTGALRYRVKVIDFGSACHSSKAVQNTYLQSRYYRAPEILLGLPFNEAIDMWSLGCVIAELFLGWPLYPGSSEYDQMRYIVETQGLPPPDLLQNASKFNSFFVRDPYHCELRLKTQEEYALETGQQAKEARKYFFTSLSQICEVSGLPGPDDPDREFEQEDRQQFANLLALMLKLRPHERVIPDAALAHPFITMIHLQAFPFSKRFHESINLMQVCHEASRRQQQQQQQQNQLLIHTKSSGSNSGIQYLSTTSLNELPSHHRLPRSALTSPIAVTAVSNPTLFTHDAPPVSQSSEVHPTRTAVAYYAAAAVAAAALAKPNGVGQTDSCYFRQNRVPVLISDSHASNTFLDRANPTHRTTATYPSSTDYSDYPAAAAAAAVLMAQQKSRTGGTRTRQVNSALMQQMSTVPRSSLSLYDLVTAGGSALSLLNAAVSAATAPVQSSASLTGVSSVRTNPFPGHFHSASSSYDGLHKLEQPLQAKYSKPESGNRLSSEAEHAALMLSSYLGREQPGSVQSGESFVATAGGASENNELCDSLNAFVQQHQHNQQKHLCRNPAIQQQPSLPFRQQSRHHQQQQALLLASNLSVAVDDPNRSKDVSSVTVRSATFSQSACLAQQAYNQAYPKHLGVLQSQSAKLSPSHSDQQQFVRQIPCSQLMDTVTQLAPHAISSKPVNGSAFANTALDVMPINLVTSDGVPVCTSGSELASIPAGSSSGLVLNSTSTTWCSISTQSLPDEAKAEQGRIQHDLTDSHISTTDQGMLPACNNVITSQIHSTSHSPDVKPDPSQTSSCSFLISSTDDGSKAHRLTVAASHTTDSTLDTLVPLGSTQSITFPSSHPKNSGETLVTPAHSSCGGRPDKKIPVGRVQPMIKQEDVSSLPSSTSRFVLSSPVSNYSSGPAHVTVGPGVYDDSPQLVAPCVVRNAYQTLAAHPQSPEAPTLTPSCPGFRKPSHIQFIRPDQQAQSTRQLSAAHAAAAAYHNLMFFQLQQQQQQQQQHHQQQQQFQHHTQRQFQQQSQLTANFPTVSTMHPIQLAAAAAAAVSTHSCIQSTNTNPLPHSELAWSTTSSVVTEDDPAAAAAASYYAAAAAAAAAVAQHGQHQQQHQHHQQQQQQQKQQLQHHYHRQELEQLLFDRHSIHLGTQLTAAEQCQLGAHLLRQQHHPLGKF